MHDNTLLSQGFFWHQNFYSVESTQINKEKKIDANTPKADSYPFEVFRVLCLPSVPKESLALVSIQTS
jgi:hypothetical protein